MEYRVHFNLHRAKRRLKRGLWTVLKKGQSKVAFYADSIVLTDATFHHGSDACVSSIVRKGSRAVCAWVSGVSLVNATYEQPHYYDALMAAHGAYYRAECDEYYYRYDDFIEIHYNPFRCQDFTTKDGRKVAAADVVVFPASDDGIQRGYCLASGIRYA
jgi:hypothetical protein